MIARVAALAFPVAVAVCLTASLAVGAAWLRVVSPITGFITFALTLLGGGAAALLLGLIGFFIAAGVEHGSRAMAAIAIAVGLGSFVLLGVMAWGARDTPAIHDVTTDTTDPPGFSAAALNAANRGRDLTYPHGARDTPDLQRRAYGDLQPIELAVSADEAYQSALLVAEDLGWTIVERDDAAHTFEAEDETSMFRFIDDVVVRVRARDVGAVVDVRSASRVGVSDMGVNAARIRRFRAALMSR